MDLLRENLEAYLKSLYGNDLTLISLQKLGETIPTTEDVKGFGYGSPLLVEYQVSGKKGSAYSLPCACSTASATTISPTGPG